MNQIAVRFIKARESCRLTAYQDSGGVWTIGWGYTGPEVVEGLVWTQAQADAKFMLRYQPCEDGIVRNLKKPANSWQQAMFISAAYNLGLSRVLSSTFFQSFNQEDGDSRLLVVSELIRYDDVSGQPNVGVLARRLLEAALFLEHTTWES